MKLAPMFQPKLLTTLALSGLLTQVFLNHSVAQNPPMRQNPAANPSQAGQNQTSQTQIGQNQVVQPNGPLTPFPPLSPQLQQYLDAVLKHWSEKTTSIERYRCDFQRWTFEPGQTDGRHGQYAKGILRFMKPDKGMFRVDDLYFYKGANQDGSPNYSKVEGRFGEYWICDGTKVHDFDRTQKEVNRYELPPQMQGNEVYNSPLPFLFGVKVNELNDRYWLQPIAPPNDEKGQPRQDIIALEAFPKTVTDAQNYLKVRIYLDKEQFLPVSMEQFLPNWTKDNDSREVFEFSNREVNWNLINRIAELLKFKEEFIPQEPPKDWTIIEHPYAAATPQGDRMAAPPNGSSEKR